LRSISSALLDYLKAKNKSLEYEQYIDFNGDNVFTTDEDISEYVKKVTVSKKLEGNFGVNVIDNATVTVINSDDTFSPKNTSGQYSGNVVPERYSQIKIGNNSEKVHLFDGYIEDIKPSYDKRTATIKLKDSLNQLKRDCPNKFYEGYKREDIIKEWLDIVGINYTADSIDSTITTINASFDGQQMLTAMQELAKSVWADFYIDNDTFYFRTRLSPDYNGEDTAIADFNLDVDSELSNTFKIKEEYSSKKLYNVVSLQSKPLIKQGRQPIWTGAKENSEVQEIYSGSDLVWDNEAQMYKLVLTYVPEDTQTEELTKNVPILEGSINVLDVENDVTYQLMTGIGDVDYVNGEIFFEDTTEKPAPTSSSYLQVAYQYHFNRVSANRSRDFLINLDNPSTDIENLNVLAKDINTLDYLSLSFYDWDLGDYTDTSADVYVKQEIFDDKKTVKVTITNNTASSIKLEGYIGDTDNTKSSMVLMGKPFKQSEVYEVTKADQNSIDNYGRNELQTIQNDYISSQEDMKRMAEYLLYKYSTPKSVLDVETIGLPFQLQDKIQVTQSNRDIDNEFVITEIKDDIKEGNWICKLKLEQAQASNWDYSDDGTPVLVGDGSTEVNYSIPSVVGNINATLITASSDNNVKVKVTWDSANEADIARYNVYRKPTGDTTYDYIGSVDTPTTAYTDATAEYNTEYSYIVTSVDNNGNQSRANNTTPTTITTRRSDTPLTPTIITNMFTDSIHLEWDNVGNVLYELRTDTNFGVDDNGLVYRGYENRYTNQNPSQRNYTYYLKSLNDNERYSDTYSTISVENIIPPTPATPTVTEFFERLWISPAPVSDNDLVGYNVYITNQDTQNTDTISVGVGQKVNYNASAGTTFDIQVSAVDSIGEGGLSSVVTATTNSVNDLTQFASDLRPVQIVDTLPTLPSGNYPSGATVYLTTDGELYTNNSGTWEVAGGAGEFSEMTGQITTTQIEDGAISTPKLQTNAVTANEIASNTITAGEISAGAISADEIASNAITADKVGTNQIITDSANIADATIDSAKIIDVSADKVTVGSSSTFEEGYNPQQVEQNAYDYADTVSKAKDKMRLKPSGAILFHFDGNVTSTNGIVAEVN